MQTFLPYSDFLSSAGCLDSKRLWKQVLEADQILRTLAGVRQGWQNHPAVRMWRGYEDALLSYRDTIVQEWLRRRLYAPPGIVRIAPPCEPPPWLGDPRLHASHRSALLAKDPDHYGQFNWPEEPMNLTLKPLAYYWPTRGEF